VHFETWRLMALLHGARQDRAKWITKWCCTFQISVEEPRIRSLGGWRLGVQVVLRGHGHERAPSELILLVCEMIGTHVMYIALPPAVLRHGACCLVAEQQTLKSSLHQCTSQIIVRIHYVLSFCTTTIVVLASNSTVIIRWNNEGLFQL
jgi:hypothetical protein